MTIIRVEYNNVLYDLDVLKETPIRLDISAIENNAIGEVFGASSQQFTLPGSRKNNRFFKHAYKVGVTGVPGLGESVRAWVISNSDTLLEGSLFLDRVVKAENGGFDYEVTLVNNVVTFNEAVKTVSLKDLDWSDLNHTLNVGAISDSWNNVLKEGKIFYPLIDLGRDGFESTGSLPNIAFDTAETASLGYINNPNTPLQVNQLTPAIQVKSILDKIFDYGGFSYSSSLDNVFQSLFVLPKQTEDLSIKGTNFSDFNFSSNKTSGDQTFTDADNWVTASFNNEILDDSNSYNSTTSTYTTQRAGTYKFSTTLNYALDPEDNDPTLLIRVRDITNSTNLKFVEFKPTEIIGNITVTTGEVNVFDNSDIQIQLQYVQGGGVSALDFIIENGSSFLSLATPINYEGGTILVGEQFDPQTKCSDFLQGLIEKFNLVIEPIYSENRTLRIETYNDWLKQGSPKDWTKKIQEAKSISIKSPLSSQQKTLIFQDAKDNDKLSKQVIDNVEGYQWGTEIIDAVSNVPQGEKTIGSYFAPVVLEGIPGAENNVIPQLYKTDNSQVERKTFKFKPRLGYKVDGQFSEIAYIGTGSVPFQYYSTISNYDSLPIVSGSTKNLHFNNSFYTPTFTSSLDTITAYDTYYNSYITDLYRDDNKILEVELYFEPHEIQNIKLNDIIFVEDNRYRINKIQGYNINNSDVVGVELISVNAEPLYPGCDFNFLVLESAMTASGGTMSTFTSGGVDYISHTFDVVGSDTFTVDSGSTTNAQVLVVAGGGGAGGYDYSDPDYYPAGGGAGQVLYSTNVTLVTGSYSISVGNLGSSSTSTAAGTNGGNSSITGSTIDLLAYGGGAGGAVDGDGLDGGSGGGAGPNKTRDNQPGSAIYGDFGNGGGQESSCTTGTAISRGGAGGGAGGPGLVNNPGAGFLTTIRGTNEYVAHGGAPGIPGTICSYSTLPPGWNQSIGGSGVPSGTGSSKGIVIITYPLPVS